MNYEKELWCLFSKGMKKFSLEDLEKRFSVQEDEKKDFYTAIFHLEQMGKIFCDEKNYYSKVSLHFCYVWGVLKLSNQNNYYISLPNKNRMIIDKKNLNGAIEGDSVFVSKCESKKKHLKNEKGVVVRCVKFPQREEKKSFYFKDTIKKQARNNIYYIEIKGKKVVVPPKFLNSAYEGDLVNVKIYCKETSQFAKVESVLKRKQEEHIFLYQNGVWLPFNGEKYAISVLGLENKVWEGMKILGKIKEKDSAGNYQIEVVNVLDESCDIALAIAMEKGFQNTFSEKVLDEVSHFQKDVYPKEHRKDLRDLMTITIDPKTALDLDDAISLEKFPSFYRLYVHIADVDAYATYGTHVFNEAIKRGTSVYPKDIVIPQFPKKLSENLCSLNPHEEKLAKTILMDYDFDGKLLNYDFFHSIIRSDKKMDYDSVNDFLLTGNDRGDYHLYQNMLYAMRELSDILSIQRVKRGGSIGNDLQEFHIDYNEKTGGIEQFYAKVHGLSQNIIENFMLAANETIAKYAYWLNIPFIYRNHKVPLEVNKFNLKEASSIFKGLTTLQNPWMFQQYVHGLCKNKSLEEKQYILDLIFRTFSKAFYDDQNIGHYALALDCYGTISSPIRKGSDFINHFVLGEALKGNFNSEGMEWVSLNLKALCQHFNERARAAEEVENEVDAYLVNAYYQKNKMVCAKIISILKEQIYIQTMEGILGIIPIRGIYNADIKNKIIYDNYGNSFQENEMIIIKPFLQKVKNNVFYFYEAHQSEDILKLERRNE